MCLVLLASSSAVPTTTSQVPTPPVVPPPPIPTIKDQLSSHSQGSSGSSQVQPKAKPHFSTVIGQVRAGAIRMDITNPEEWAAGDVAVIRNQEAKKVRDIGSLIFDTPIQHDYEEGVFLTFFPCVFSFFLVCFFPCLGCQGLCKTVKNKDSLCFLCAFLVFWVFVCSKHTLQKKILCMFCRKRREKQKTQGKEGQGRVWIPQASFCSL